MSSSRFAIYQLGDQPPNRWKRSAALSCNEKAIARRRTVRALAFSASRGSNGERCSDKLCYFFCGVLFISDEPEPVVPFGLGTQVPCIGFATFSQSAMLAYLQSVAPVILLLLQNADPVATRLLSFFMVVWALAMETPAVKAAMATRAVSVFMVFLLE